MAFLEPAAAYGVVAGGIAALLAGAGYAVVTKRGYVWAYAGTALSLYHGGGLLALEAAVLVRAAFRSEFSSRFSEPLDALAELLIVLSAALLLASAWMVARELRRETPSARNLLLSAPLTLPFILVMAPALLPYAVVAGLFPAVATSCAAARVFDEASRQ